MSSRLPVRSVHLFARSGTRLCRRRLVTGLIRRELLRERLPVDLFGSPEPGQVVLARTADRGVLGCMTDKAFLCEMTISQSGGLARANVADLSHALRRHISGARRYARPIELAAQRLHASRQGSAPPGPAGRGVIPQGSAQTQHAVRN